MGDDDLERRLSAAAEALREYELTRQREAEVDARVREASEEVDALRARHASEVEDVERLEGLTLTRVIASLRGARDDHLARERAEADAARYRLREAESRLAALRHDQAAVRARLAALATTPRDFAAVLDEKERYLRESGDPAGRQLLDLAEEHGRLTGELREIGEAREAAGAARRALAVTQQKLSSAASWSAYDTFFGGGVIGSAVKHSRLDDAAAAATRADHCLARLRTELADVDAAVPAAPRLEVDGLTRLVDIWFDNIFTDLAVRSRIKRAQEAVARTIGQVDGVRAGLDLRAAHNRGRIASIVAERRDLLAGPDL